MLDGHRLHDHPAHRQAHHVGAVDAHGVEHGDAVGRHVADEVGVARLAHRRTGERGGQAHVAVVEADDVQALGGEHLAPVVLVVDALAAEAVHHQQRRVGGDRRRSRSTARSRRCGPSVMSLADQFLAQLALEELAVGVPRQLVVAEPDLRRDLVLGDALGRGTSRSSASVERRHPAAARSRRRPLRRGARRGCRTRRPRRRRRAGRSRSRPRCSTRSRRRAAPCPWPGRR